jgi:lipoprotein-anchoring transpeptidase ErfK/SrfK
MVIEKIADSKFAKFIKMLALSSTLGMSACASQTPHEPPQLNLKEKEGKLVPVSEILNQKIPEEYLQKIFDIVNKHKRGMVISKLYNIHYLFENGKIINRGPVGTARTKMGYETPEGEFKVLRKEGHDYKSKEFAGAEMGYAIFFTDSGKAFHTSTNYVIRYNKETGQKEVFLLINSSHGCANGLFADAQIANMVLQIGDIISIID